MSSDKRHLGAQFGVQAITNFHWTLNQEALFSSALMGKPARKEDFEQYCWKRCVIGSRVDYVEATAHLEWDFALQHGNLWELKKGNDDALIPQWLHIHRETRSKADMA